MEQKKTRRSVLKHVTAASGALAASSSIVGAVDTDNERTLQIGETYTTEQGEALSVTSASVRQSLVYRLEPDSPRVYGRPGTRYVFANVETDLEDVPSDTRLSDYGFIAGDTQYSTTTGFGSVAQSDVTPVYDDLQHVFRPGEEDIWLEQRTGGSIAANISESTDASRLGVTFTGDDNVTVTWEFDEATVERFNSRPDFTVTDFGVEGPGEPGSELAASLTIRNDGDAGVFRGVLGPSASNHPIAVEQSVGTDSTTQVSTKIQFPRTMSQSQLETAQRGGIEFTLVTPDGSSVASEVSSRGGKR